MTPTPSLFPTNSMNSCIFKKLVVFLGTNECMKNVSVDDPRMVLCVKHCTGFDPILLNYTFPFGEKIKLPNNPAYRWEYENGTEVSSITCDFKDFGGLRQRIERDDYK